VLCLAVAFVMSSHVTQVLYVVDSVTDSDDDATISSETTTANPLPMTVRPLANSTLILLNT